MKNIERWRNLVRSASSGEDFYFRKEEKITLGEIFPLADMLKKGKKRAVIVLWGKNLRTPSAATVKQKRIKERWERLVNRASFGQDTLFFSKEEITLGKIFGLVGCVDASELIAREDLAVLFLWGDNLTAETPGLRAGDKVRPLSVPLSALGGAHGWEVIREIKEFTIANIWFWPREERWLVRLKDVDGAFPASGFTSV